MLVLSRRVSEKIVINDEITVTVVRISGNKVRIGIEAPNKYRITRGELVGDDSIVTTENRDQNLSGSAYDMAMFQ